MKCRNPFIKAGRAHGCGQCMPCRFNWRRIWTHRIVLEALEHKDNCFLTLTYDEDNVPRSGSGAMTLDPEHTRNFLKRLRSQLWYAFKIRMRYFIVGEYGDDTWRPHYHLAVFGIRCVRGRTLRRLESRSRPLWRECCPVCRMVGETWGFGDIDIGSLEVHSAQYLAGYVTKKMTRNDDPRLQGRHPEFTRKSLKPGLGANHMHDVASVMLSLDLEARSDDVPSSLQHGRRSLPLGRYLRSKLRTYIGREKNAPASELQRLELEMLPVRLDARNDKSDPSFKSHLVKAGDQEVINQETRAAIYKQRKHL